MIPALCHPARIACLLLAAAISASAQAYRITGTLSDPQSTPVPHAHLNATPDKPCQSAARDPETDADAQGHFALALPCSGTWRLTAEASNFASQSFEQHDAYSTGVVLTPSHPALDLVFHMIPKASITGFILDEAGDPVRDARLTLLSATDAEPKPLASATTDDRGFYEFPNLLPGAYQLAVQTQPWYAMTSSRDAFARAFLDRSAPQPNPQDPSLDLTYPITWFPGVTDQASATPLILADGAAQQADIHLSPVASVHLLIPGAGRLQDRQTGLDRGRRLPTVPPIQQLSALGETDFHPTSVNLTDDGSVDIAGFAPGTYALARRSRDAADRQLFEVQKDSPHILNLASTQPPAAPLSQGTLHLTGIALSDRKPSQGAMLLLVPATGSEAHIRRAQTNTDGSFDLDRLAPGNYILAAIDHGWSVDWRAPTTLTPYLLRGTPIHLTASTALKQPIEAQAP